VASLAQQLTPDDKLKSKPVKEAMIARAQMHIERPDFRLVNALTWLDQENRGRIPVLDADDKPKYVIHRSSIDRFLAQNARSNAPVPVANLGLPELLADPQIGPMLRDSFGTVAATATLADAKASMSASSSRQDVFVTKSGSPNEAVLGWLTNITIEENAKV
jgi:hypothetical protein